MWAAERDALLRLPPWKRDRVTIYAVIPADSAWDLSVGITCLTGLVTIPSGWWLGGWPGALVGMAIGPLLLGLSAGFTVDQLRLDPGGTLDVRAPWRRTTIRAASVREVRSYFEVGEPRDTWRLVVRHELGSTTVPHFPEMAAFIHDLQAFNPGLLITGEWPNGKPPMSTP